MSIQSSDESQSYYSGRDRAHIEYMDAHREPEQEGGFTFLLDTAAPGIYYYEVSKDGKYLGIVAHDGGSRVEAAKKLEAEG